MIRRDNDYYIVLPKWVVHHFVASLMEGVLIDPWVLGYMILQQNHTCVVQKMPELLWLLILRPHPKTGYTFRVCKTRERPKFWPKPMVFNIAVFNLICWVDHLFFWASFIQFPSLYYYHYQRGLRWLTSTRLDDDLTGDSAERQVPCGNICIFSAFCHWDLGRGTTAQAVNFVLRSQPLATIFRLYVLGYSWLSLIGLVYRNRFSLKPIWKSQWIEHWGVKTSILPKFILVDICVLQCQNGCNGIPATCTTRRAYLLLDVGDFKHLMFSYVFLAVEGDGVTYTSDSFLHDALASTRHDQWVSRLCPLNIWSLNASLFHKKQRKRTWGKMIKGISVFQNEHVSMFICEAKLFVHRQQPDAYVHPKLCWWMSVRSDVNKFHTAFTGTPPEPDIRGCLWIGMLADSQYLVWKSPWKVFSKKNH